jgi:hypothetical protein
MESNPQSDAGRHGTARVAERDETHPPRSGRRFLLVLLLLATAGAGVVATEPTDAAEVVIGMTSGVIGWSVWWLLLGGLVWLLRYTIRRRRAFGEVMLAPGLLAVMLAIAVASIPGVIAINAREDERLSARSASAADTDDELSVEQEAIVDYLNGMIPCAEGATEGRRLERSFIRALKDGRWEAATRFAALQRDNIDEMSLCLGDLLPTGDAQIDAVAEPIAEGTGRIASAWATYERASRNGDIDLLGVGDQQVVRARRASQRAAVDFEEIYHDRDPHRMARYIDFERLARARLSAGLE